MAGTLRAYGTWNKKGTHLSTKTGREHFFRSSWEEAVMRHLDNSAEVKTWDYECVRIPYVYNEHKRWYVPDFVVSFNDNRKEVWEVKPEQFLQTERVMNTIAAGKEHCREHGMSYVVLTGRVLAERGIL